MSYSVNSLYEKYRDDIYYYLISLTHNNLIAEDLTGETILGAITALPNFKGKSDIKTWLFSIARHKWYEYLRALKKSQNITEKLEMYISESDCSLERKVEDKEVLKRLSELLDKEPERSKKILIMRAEGYSFYEIGNKIGISENSSRVIDFRTRKKIKEILVKEGYDYE